MDGGMIGGIVGSVIGCMGAAFGCYMSIKNTNGPKEKQFMIKCVVIATILIGLFGAGIMLLPKPYNHLLWIPYAIILPLSIIILNKKQAKIRLEESESNNHDEANTP